MTSVVRKMTVPVVIVCLLSACGVQQKERDEAPRPAEQRSDQNDRLVRLENHPETDQIYTQTEFILPIKEEWYVFWGGTNQRDNDHYAYPSQRYAIDLVIRKNGRDYEGDKDKNESYYAFGKEIIAPADGRVVEVERRVKDNEPVGEMNAAQPFGNYVIIDHGNGEYSVIGHMKYESPVVKVGDAVKQGQLVGLCGNSGNSSEPHIHFQVSDTPHLNKVNPYVLGLKTTKTRYAVSSSNRRPRPPRFLIGTK